MNARIDQFPAPQAPKGPISRLLTFMVVQLAAMVDWKKVDLSQAHLGGEFGVSFGTHSVTLGNLITMDNQAPSAMGQIGMDTSTGRVQAYIGGAARSIPGSHEVLALSGGTLSGNIAMGTNKITGLGNGSTGSQDAATVSQMETYVGDLIAQKVDVGSAGQGLIGHGSITEINAVTPVAGNVVVAENSGTPSAGTSDALAAGDVAEFDGTSWKKIVSNVGGFVPLNTRILVSTVSAFISGGGLTDNTDEGKIAYYDGTSLTQASFTTPSDGVIVAVKGEGALAENSVLAFDGSVPTGAWRATAAAGVAHSSLTGLTSGDDHTQYALLAGRSGGQTYVGGSGASDNLTLESTSNGTKGNVRVASGTRLVMLGDDSIVPATSNQCSVGTSSKKFKEVYATNVYTGDLNLAHPDGDPSKSWKLVEEVDGLSATNLGTGVEHRVVMVRKGSMMDALCRILG